MSFGFEGIGRLALLTGAMGLLLGSAAPPPEGPLLPWLQAENVLADAPQAPVELAFAAEEAAEPAPGRAALQTVLPPAPKEAQAETAAPAPVLDASSGVRVVVSLPLQKAYVFEDGELLWTAPVSTGKSGHETPVGTFPILQKKVHHRSSTYDDAPMPYMQRLTWQGVALHAGRVPGYPASHGCIRLPSGYAKKLYDLTDFDTVVTITREKPATAEDALELV